MDWSDEPEAARLSLPAKRKEYRDHHTRTKSGSGGASDIHIYYDGLDDIEVCSWISSTETQLRRMVYGERINELLEHTDYTGPTSYYAHADKLDSVMLLVLNNGTIKESYRYTDYGQPTVVDDTFAKLTTLNSNVGNWKRYTGQEHALMSSVSDPWQFYRARAYRADAGRFVQRDPKRYHDGASLYVAVRGSPMNGTDPLGEQTLGTSLYPVHGAVVSTRVKWENILGWTLVETGVTGQFSCNDCSCGYSGTGFSPISPTTTCHVISTEVNGSGCMTQVGGACPLSSGHCVQVTVVIECCKHIGLQTYCYEATIEYPTVCPAACGPRG